VPLSLIVTDVRTSYIPLSGDDGVLAGLVEALGRGSHDPTTSAAIYR
jgi:hypothetical protein